MRASQASTKRSIAAASYVLCAWGDEQFDAAPWGAGGAGLLQHFHGEADGGDKLLRLLARLAEKPREHRALLELFHTCLSLGLRARTAIDRPRPRSPALARAPRAATGGAGSGVGGPLALRAGGRPPAAGAAHRVAGGPAARRAGLGRLQRQPAAACRARRRRAGVFAAARAGTHRRRGCRARARRRRRRGWPPRCATTSPPAACRCATRRCAAWSWSAPTRCGDANGPLTRLGAALAKLPGKVLVVGYTDGSDPPTARTPSAWHQAMEWARGAADVLRPQVGDARLAVEARVDAAAGQPPRRVEIVLFPE